MDKKENLKLILLPVGILVIFALFVVGYKLLNLPDKAEVIASAESYYVQYGYTTVFVGALAEGMLFLNWYLPGSIVAVLGVVFAKNNDLNIYFMVSLIILAFFTTSLINYALGR